MIKSSSEGYHLVKGMIEKYSSQPNPVLPVLQDIQARFHYIPQDYLHAVCELAHLSYSKLISIITFYSQLRLKPAGKHLIEVCVGTACHVKGANQVFTKLQETLSIDSKEDTDPDKLFTIKKVACLGCCTLAPVIKVDEIIYGRLLIENSVDDVLNDFLKNVHRGKKTEPQEKKLSTKKQQPSQIHICLCSSCKACGSDQVYDQFKHQIEEYHLNAQLKQVACTGISYDAPLVDIITPQGEKIVYGSVQKDDVETIVYKNFTSPKLIKQVNLTLNHQLQKIYSNGLDNPVVRHTARYRPHEIGEYQSMQKLIVTEHAGVVHPVDLEEYRAAGGFTALQHVLSQMSPEAVIQSIEQSGLRGRGGGGFHTAVKWNLVRMTQADEKYIICNGDEGDPGAFMDRMIMESFPFRLIEGTIITSFAVGAHQGILYIRNEYPLANERIERVIQNCYDHQLLGENILGSSHSFDLQIVKGAGAFICGEETAMIAALEGKRGMPKIRPPYPSEKGLWGKPTLINNVETLTQVPWIIKSSASAYQKLGTSSSKGTKTFALAGKINKGGLIEVEMGTTVRDIVYRIGAGIPDNKQLKAVQIGGPSGGCIPASLADTPIDYESLKNTGAIMGSGGMVVLDEEDCMVDIARYFISFNQTESCGKCTFCRVGTKRLLDILDRIYYGTARPTDLDELVFLAHYVKKGSLCNLGKTSVNPVLTTLKYFKEEYEAHINGKCLAGSCVHLITYTITDDCIGCTICARQCPVAAISGAAYTKQVIDPQLCIRCGNCYKVCPVNSVNVE